MTLKKKNSLKNILLTMQLNVIFPSSSFPIVRDFWYFRYFSALFLWFWPCDKYAWLSCRKQFSLIHPWGPFAIDAIRYLFSFAYIEPHLSIDGRGWASFCCSCFKHYISYNVGVKGSPYLCKIGFVGINYLAPIKHNL